MNLDVEYEDRKLNNDRIDDDNKKLTNTEIKQNMKMIEEFLESEQYANVEELKDFFQNISQDNLDRGMFLVNKLPKLQSESRQVHQDVSKLLKMVIEEKEAFTRGIETRKVAFWNKQERKTQEMQNIFNLYRLLNISTIAINIGLIGFVLYKLLPFISANFT